MSSNIKAYTAAAVQQKRDHTLKSSKFLICHLGLPQTHKNNNTNQLRNYTT